CLAGLFGIIKERIIIMLVHPNPDPAAFSIGPVDIHWFGLRYVGAFALFLILGRVRIKQPHIAAQGWKNEDLDDMLFYGMLGVVLGGRLGEVLFYQPARSEERRVGKE